MSTDEYRWCRNAMAFGGDFIKCFAEAVFRADDANTVILAPAFQQLMFKYPHYSNWPVVEGEDAREAAP